MKHLIQKQQLLKYQKILARRLYSGIFYLLLPLVMLRLCYRASKSRAYAQRITERFGYFNAPGFVKSMGFNGAIWVHCVSVGETIAATPLIKQLQQQSPDTPLVVTTMTPTGSARVKAFFGDSVFHVYAPYDLPASIKRFLNRVQPKLVIIMETELWPNTLHYCYQKKIPVVLANARLSAKSAKGYQRLSPLSHPMLQNLSKVAAQHQTDADRFISLGLPAQRVEVIGSIKFDIQIDESLKKKASQLKLSWSNNGKRLIFVAASTHEGEEEHIVTAYQQVLIDYPQMLLVLVPRHPERFNKVAVFCQRMGLSTLRRSQMKIESSSLNNPLDQGIQVVIGDTMGELLLFYGCSDFAFVGGSLIEHGGHNIVEPAAWGLPIVTGNSDYNFSEISRLLQHEGAMKKINNAQELARYLLILASDISLRRSAGDAALSVVKSNCGVIPKLLTLLKTFL